MNYKIDMCTIFRDTRKLLNEESRIFFTATGKYGEQISEEYNAILTTNSEALINLLKFLETENVKSIKVEFEKKSV